MERATRRRRRCSGHRRVVAVGEHRRVVAVGEQQRGRVGVGIVEVLLAESELLVEQDVVLGMDRARVSRGRGGGRGRGSDRGSRLDRSRKRGRDRERRGGCAGVVGVGAVGRGDRIRNASRLGVDEEWGGVRGSAGRRAGFERARRTGARCGRR